MTDEFYLCAECGVEEGGTYTTYRYQGHNISDELAGMMEDELPLELSDEIIEVEVCCECDNDYTGIMYASTRD